MTIRQSTMITASVLAAFLFLGMSTVHAGDGCPSKKGAKGAKGDETTTLWQPAETGTAVERV
jgi:hypothetical protein